MPSIHFARPTIFYVYVLQLRNGELYIGFSSNLKGRLQEHKRGEGGFTSDKLPFKLIYYEAYVNKMDALGREKFLKGGSGRRYLNKQLKNCFNEVRE